MVVLLAVVSSTRTPAWPRPCVYALAYTVELGFSLLAYYGQEPTA